MRDSSSNYFLRGSWREDFSTGLGELADRIAGLEWMAQEHVLEALRDPDPRVRGKVKDLLKATRPDKALASQALTDVAETAHPTGRPVVFKRYAAQMAGRVRSAEDATVKELTHPSQTLVDILRYAPNPTAAAERFMQLKTLQAMIPNLYTDEQIDEVFSREISLGGLGLVGARNVRIAPAKPTAVRSREVKLVIINTPQATVPAAVEQAAQRTFSNSDNAHRATEARRLALQADREAREARKREERASREAAHQALKASRAQSRQEADAARLSAQQAAAEAQRAADEAAKAAAERAAAEQAAAQYAAAQAAATQYVASQQPSVGTQYTPPVPSDYETPQPTWTPAPSGGGGGSEVATDPAPVTPAEEIPVATEPASRVSGGVAAGLMAAAAAAAFFLFKGE